jgi:hypothetical protein
MMVFTEIAARPNDRLTSRIARAEGTAGVVVYTNNCTFTRSARAVNSLTRGLFVIVFSLGMFGVSGCSTDNETEATKLSKGMGDPGKGAVAPVVDSEPPPKTQAEFFNRQADPKKAMGANYPKK